MWWRWRRCTALRQGCAPVRRPQHRWAPAAAVAAARAPAACRILAVAVPVLLVIWAVLAVDLQQTKPARGVGRGAACPAAED